MRTTITLCLAAAALMLAGCSSTPTRVDHGPIQARTFNFFNSGAKTPPSFSENEAQINAKLQEIITANLAAKGLARVPSGGDVTVGYLVIISDGAATSAINDYFGYSSGDLQDKAHKAFAIDDKNPTPYPAGTLVIDIMDSKTWKLLRRNYVCRPVMRQLPLNERVARLQEAVDEALKGIEVAK